MRPQALKHIPRRAYFVGTKVGRYELDYARMFDFRGKRVLESIDQSLFRLGLKQLDLCQVQVRVHIYPGVHCHS